MSEHEEPEQMACAVCARKLNSRAYDSGEVVYTHADFDEENLDHPPVPVDPGEVHTEYRCDFCNADRPLYRLPANSFPVGMGAMSGTDWAACALCAPYIEQNQWNALVRHVAASWEARHKEKMPEEVREALRATYRRLRKHITGALRLIADES